MPDEPAQTPVVSQESETPKATRRDTIIGGVVMAVIGVFVLVKCLPSSTSDKMGSGVKSAASDKSNAEANRAALLAAMRLEHPQVFRSKAEAMKIGVSEDWAKAVFGEPWKDERDGKGGHLYVWAGNGITVSGYFRNLKCEAYQVLDEEDVKALKLPE